MRPRGSALAAAILLLGCSTDDPGSPAETDADAASCGGRGDPIFAGLVKSSNAGFTFEVAELDPETPIISQSEPGNTWKIAVTDGSGEALSGASMAVSTFMPDHNHSGPPSVGVEQDPGVYVIEDLLLPMPALYSVTIKVRPAGASADETVSYSICVSAQSG